MIELTQQREALKTILQELSLLSNPLDLAQIEKIFLDNKHFAPVGEKDLDQAWVQLDLLKRCIDQINTIKNEIRELQLDKNPSERMHLAEQQFSAKELELSIIQDELTALFDEFLSLSKQYPSTAGELATQSIKSIDDRYEITKNQLTYIFKVYNDIKNERAQNAPLIAQRDLILLKEQQLEFTQQIIPCPNQIEISDYESLKEWDAVKSELNNDLTQLKSAQDAFNQLLQEYAKCKATPLPSFSTLDQIRSKTVNELETIAQKMDQLCLSKDIKQKIQQEYDQSDNIPLLVERYRQKASTLLSNAMEWTSSWFWKSDNAEQKEHDLSFNFLALLKQQREIQDQLKTIDHGMNSLQKIPDNDKTSVYTEQQLSTKIEGVIRTLPREISELSTTQINTDPNKKLPSVELMIICFPLIPKAIERYQTILKLIDEMLPIISNIKRHRKQHKLPKNQDNYLSTTEELKAIVLESPENTKMYELAEKYFAKTELFLEKFKEIEPFEYEIDASKSALESQTPEQRALLDTDILEQEKLLESALNNADDIVAKINNPQQNLLSQADAATASDEAEPIRHDEYELTEEYNLIEMETESLLEPMRLDSQRLDDLVPERKKTSCKLPPALHEPTDELSSHHTIEEQSTLSIEGVGPGDQVRSISLQSDALSSIRIPTEIQEFQSETPERTSTEYAFEPIESREEPTKSKPQVLSSGFSTDCLKEAVALPIPKPPVHSSDSEIEPTLNSKQPTLELPNEGSTSNKAEPLVTTELIKEPKAADDTREQPCDIKIDEYRFEREQLLGWHTANIDRLSTHPEELMNWYLELYSVVESAFQQATYSFKYSHLIRDVFFELEVKKDLNLLYVYKNRCPSPKINSDSLLLLKPNHKISEAFLCELDKELTVPPSLKKLRDQYNNLKIRHPVEAELLLHNIEFLYSIHKDPARHEPTFIVPTVMEDPRYDALKRHRGFLKIWEAIEDFFHWIMNKITGAIEPEYHKKPCFFNTRSVQLIKEAELSMAPSTLGA